MELSTAQPIPLRTEVPTVKPDVSTVMPPSVTDASAFTTFAVHTTSTDRPAPVTISVPEMSTPSTDTVRITPVLETDSNVDALTYSTYEDPATDDISSQELPRDEADFSPVPRTLLICIGIILIVVLTLAVCVAMIAYILKLRGDGWFSSFTSIDPEFKNFNNIAYDPEAAKDTIPRIKESSDAVKVEEPTVMGPAAPINAPRLDPYVKPEDCTVMTRAKMLPVPRMAECFDDEPSSSISDMEDGDLGMCMTRQYQRSGARTRSMGAVIRDGETFYDITP